MNRRMNDGLQRYLLRRLVESIKKELQQHFKADVDIESDLDGVLDSYDNLLTFEENISNIKQAIEDIGYNLDFIDEDRILKEREQKFDLFLQSLSMFKNKIFSLNCRIHKYNSEKCFYEKGYQKLSVIWRRLEHEICEIPFEYANHNKINELLRIMKKEDTYASYNKRFKQRAYFKGKLLIKDPRVKHTIPTPKLSEKDLMQNIKQTDKSTP